MIYFVTALVLVILVSAVYFSYKRSSDQGKLLRSLGLLILLLILTYSTKILLVYKPLLVLHIALLIMAWWSYMRYIIKNILTLYWILSPIISFILFIIIALFFRENG